MAVCCIYLDIKGLEGWSVAKKGRYLKILKTLKLLEWSVAKKGTIILPWLCRQPKRPSKLPHNHHRAASKLNLEHRLT